MRIARSLSFLILVLSLMLAACAPATVPVEKAAETESVSEVQTDAPAATEAMVENVGTLKIA